jgi:hypothetical protein
MRVLLHKRIISLVIGNVTPYILSYSQQNDIQVVGKGSAFYFTLPLDK